VCQRRPARIRIHRRAMPNDEQRAIGPHKESVRR
jgi:hypothetical protein